MDVESKLGNIRIGLDQEPDRKEVLNELRVIKSKIDFLFAHPLKFHKDYLWKLDPINLQILVLAIGWSTDITKVSEVERRKIFEKIIKDLELRKLTYKEYCDLVTALGFPRPKETRSQWQFRESIQKLVKDLRRMIEAQPRLWSNGKGDARWRIRNSTAKSVKNLQKKQKRKHN